MPKAESCPSIVTVLTLPEARSHEDANRLAKMNQHGWHTSLRTRKGTAGRATRDVSSRKTRVLEKGIAYKNVGSLLQRKSATAPGNLKCHANVETC